MRANISGASFPNELRNLLQRRLEDLENQLLKKVNELEEEKSQLYNETVAHRQRTDSTLNSLMNRISELEKGLHKTLFCSLVILLSQVQETRQCCNTFDFNVCNYLALCASKFDNIFPYFSVIVLQFTSWFPLLLIMAVRIIFLNVWFKRVRDFITLQCRGGTQVVLWSVSIFLHPSRDDAIINL